MSAKRPGARPYSREFTSGADSAAYYIDGLPVELWQRVRTKAAREGVSMRTLILRLLTAWVEA